MFLAEIETEYISVLETIFLFFGSDFSFISLVIASNDILILKVKAHMRIPLIQTQDADSNIAGIYERFTESGLGVYNVMKLWANEPAFLEAFELMINALYQDKTLSARYRELAWLRTSQINSCHY